jgi:hypothetical protein
LLRPFVLVVVAVDPVGTDPAVVVVVVVVAAAVAVAVAVVVDLVAVAVSSCAFLAVPDEWLLLLLPVGPENSPLLRPDPFVEVRDQSYH